MNTLLRRFYSDYAMPSRLAMYEDFIGTARDAGYAQISVRQYQAALRRGLDGAGKFVVHRHDIDTDLRTTRKLFEIEKRHKIHSSFYFRLSTLDFDLMREIEAYGSEAAYHYEELASFAKKNRIRSASDVRGRLAEIRDDFHANFRRIEQGLGKKITTVAGHGDFANRKLKLNNTEILADLQLRERCGIECEAYDRALLDNIDLYVADRPAPQYYHPCTPFEAIRSHRRICLVTHPRQFETNWMENTKDNLFRFYEGLAW